MRCVLIALMVVNLHKSVAEVFYQLILSLSFVLAHALVASNTVI